MRKHARETNSFSREKNTKCVFVLFQARAVAVNDFPMTWERKKEKKKKGKKRGQKEKRKKEEREREKMRRKKKKKDVISFFDLSRYRSIGI